MLKSDFHSQLKQNGQHEKMKFVNFANYSFVIICDFMFLFRSDKNIKLDLTFPLGYKCKELKMLNTTANFIMFLSIFYKRLTMLLFGCPVFSKKNE